jgi:phosphate:Na+ symporter
MSLWQIVFGALAGLVLFLYGIEHFSTEIQTVAGDRFRAWIGKLTKSPLRGAVLGAVTTMVVQSSSATTVIAVGLVNSGIISFAASLGIIFGANVGTTVTAQLVALKLTSFAPVFVVLGFAVSLVGGKYRFLGRPVFYFGLVFLALALVSDAIEPLRNDPRAPELIARFASVPLALAAGFVFTAVVQSSSVTTGLVVLLADAGVVSIVQAIPILLGANLGTTTTSLLAASRMSLHARRAAVGHLMYNAGGLLLFLPVLEPFAELVTDLGGGSAQQVANAHLIFNGLAAVVFLAAVRPLTWAIEQLVKGEEEEILFVTRSLGDRLPEDVPAAFALVEDELRNLYGVTGRVFDAALALIQDPTPRARRLVEKLEGLNDFLDERIEAALLELSARSLSSGDAAHVLKLVRVSNQLERLGDAGAQVGALADVVEESRARLSVASKSDLHEANAGLQRIFAALEPGFPELTADTAEAAKRHQRALRKIINETYARHVQRMATEERYPGAAVVDALSTIESASSQLRELRKQLESPTEIPVA